MRHGHRLAQCQSTPSFPPLSLSSRAAAPSLARFLQLRTTASLLSDELDGEGDLLGAEDIDLRLDHLAAVAIRHCARRLPPPSPRGPRPLAIVAALAGAVSDIFGADCTAVSAAAKKGYKNLQG